MEALRAKGYVEMDPSELGDLLKAATSGTEKEIADLKTKQDAIMKLREGYEKLPWHKRLFRDVPATHIQDERYWTLTTLIHKVSVCLERNVLLTAYVEAVKLGSKVLVQVDDLRRIKLWGKNA